MIRVLYDGWPVVYQPESPASLHLLAILASSSGHVEPVVALPGEPPGWFPEDVIVRLTRVEDTPGGRLRWQQNLFPGLTKSVNAALMHGFTTSPPVFSSVPTVISPASETFFLDPSNCTHLPERPGRRSLTLRLSEALASGGMARLSGLFWPLDMADHLPRPGRYPVILLPPFDETNLALGNEEAYATAVHLEMPENYVLYHGPNLPQVLRIALQGWSWVHRSLGEAYTLVMLGLDPNNRQSLLALCQEFSVSGSVQALAPTSPALYAKIYSHCQAFYHPAPISPWGGPLRRALAYGKPVVACGNPLAGDLVGPAAYLVSENRSRQLGAALITVLVEEQVAESLSQAAVQRAAQWDNQPFRQRLLESYHEIAGR